MIQGVHVKPLKVIPDDRGRLTEMLRKDDPFFTGFGQVYFTTTYPGVVKAWHFHRHQADNMVCLVGCVKLALYDDRDASPTRGWVNEFWLSEHRPILVHVPKLVYHGWKCVSDRESIVVNTVDQVYDYKNPDEFRRAAHGDIPYDWTVQDR
ncbi:MAG: dTDP-4-dehydrorhamnose 3,5-epimerase family protein [Planctomycetes bacterium]|nr:dTDP-4-dehydrorhamnose 3,5-epimerase family protein [Planctomycetota bacterium]